MRPFTVWIDLNTVLVADLRWFTLLFLFLFFVFFIIFFRFFFIFFFFSFFLIYLFNFIFFCFWLVPFYHWLYRVCSKLIHAKRVLWMCWPAHRNVADLLVLLLVTHNTTHTTNIYFYKRAHVWMHLCALRTILF